MTEHQDTTAVGAIVRIIGVILAWLGSLKIADVQSLVAIASGLGVLAYTALQMWVLWRDKIRARQS